MLGEDGSRLSTRKHLKYARAEALAFAQRISKDKKSNLLVVDEINLALHCQLLETRKVLEFLDKIPKKQMSS